MKKIRNKNLADNTISDIRKVRKPIARRIYLITLVIFCISILNHFQGGRIMLRATGTIERDLVQIDAPFVMQVQEVLVEPGDSVVAGQPIIRFDSVEMRLELNAIETIEQQNSAALHKLNTRAEILQNQESQLLDYLEKLRVELKSTEALLAKKLIANTQVLSLRKDVMDLETRIEQIHNEMSQTQTDINFYNQQLANLDGQKTTIRELFHDGFIAAPITGEIGSNIASQGEVLIVGEPIFEVNHGTSYARVYIPNEHIFDIKKDMPVTVKLQTRKIEGIVREVLLLSEVTPQEFNNSVRAPGRQQMLKVDLLHAGDLPINQQVYVSSAHSLKRQFHSYWNSTRDTFSRYINQLALASGVWSSTST